jgi:hypothetical protein
MMINREYEIVDARLRVGREILHDCSLNFSDSFAQYEYDRRIPAFGNTYQADLRGKM